MRNTSEDETDYNYVYKIKKFKIDTETYISRGKRVDFNIIENWPFSYLIFTILIHDPWPVNYDLLSLF